MAQKAEMPSRRYRFEEISTGGILRDLADFHGGPVPGEPMPDFDLLTVEGNRARKRDFVGSRPALITFASLSCPMTASAAAPLKRLHADFGRAAGFLTVYVREAHPGEKIPQASDRDEKVNYAHIYQQRDAIPWQVAADGIDGEFHQRMGSHPNAAYLVDSRGEVVFRALWSNDEAGLRRALEAVVSGRPLRLSQSRARLLPVLTGVGCLSETLEGAGPEAGRQLRRKAPPLYVLGRVAAAFKPLPPLGRGLAAVGVLGLALTGIFKAFNTRRR